MLRGFQAAQDASKGELLRQTLADNPDRVYHALLTVNLRLVFLLYAEERGHCCPKDEDLPSATTPSWDCTSALREDAALFPDTMGPALRRLGPTAGAVPTHPRRRRDRGDEPAQAARRPLRTRTGFPFLEGRPGMVARQIYERIEPPLVSDGHHLPRPGEAAGSRRRADLLPGPRRGADRLGLRDHDGVPPGDRERKVGGDQGCQEAGRTHDRGPGCVSPASGRRHLSPPPMRRARPPASSTPAISVMAAILYIFHRRVRSRVPAEATSVARVPG